MAVALAGLVNLAATQSHPTESVYLAAAVQVLLTTLGIQLDPEEQAIYDQGLNTARAALDQSRFQAAWSSGEAATLDEATSLALTLLPAPDRTPASTAEQAGLPSENPPTLLAAETLC
jgi:hypothetical protein